MISEQQLILEDLDRLQLGYQIKLYSVAQQEWQPYFYELSLDSHQHNQLFLDRNQLISNYRPSIVFSGLALCKDCQLKEIKLVSSDNTIIGTFGCPSPVLGARRDNIANSEYARWQCPLTFNAIKSKQSWDLIFVLNNDYQFIYKKIEFYAVELAQQSEAIQLSPNQKLASKIDSICQSRQQMDSNRLQNRQYLFAVGNARSGTTVLGELLNSSPEICLGVERYHNEDNVTADSFEPEAFFDETSENYLVRPHHYVKIKDKFSQAIYVGDKRPRFTKSWQNTWLNLPKAQIIYVFRNIYDVAFSYNARANAAVMGIDESWSSSRDFSRAVQDWNQGLQKFPKMAQFFNVYCIKYDEFFIDKSKMKRLLDYLEVDATKPQVKARIEQIYQTATSLQNKSRTLSEDEIKYIDAYADFSAYNQVLAFYERQSNQAALTK